MNLLLHNWETLFYEEIEKTKTLRIISPFLSKTVTKKVSETFKGRSFELITRYSEKDFTMGVSSIKALKKLIKKGVNIYGIKGLHSKVYIFDERLAIVTSANLTEGGLINNKEVGVSITDRASVKELIEYFEKLKATNEAPLTIQQCEKWEKNIADSKIKKPDTSGLKDHGAPATLFNPNRNYFLKFLGESDNRRDLDFETRKVIANSGCYYMVGFSEKRKPTGIREGDVVYMARMTQNPNDHFILGRAIAHKFDVSKDMITDQEKKIRDWMDRWPALLKVHRSEFINGELGQCISLQNMAGKFDYDLYKATQYNHKKKEGNTDPRRAIVRKPGIELSLKAAEYLENEFNLKLKSVGKVDQDFIDSKPKPEKAIER